MIVRPRLRAVAGVALCAALATACGPAPDVPGAADVSAGAGTPGATAAPAPAGAAGANDPHTYASELFRLTNEARAAEGLPALGPSTCAEDAARERALAIGPAGPLEHAPMDDVLADCAPSTQAAENLVRAAAAPADVVQAWLGSPGHRANLLSESVSRLGVGCVPDGSTLVCAQIFLGP